MDSNLTGDAIERIVDLARAGMGPQAVPKGNVPYVLVPEGYKAEAMPDLVYNEHAATPERIKGTVTVVDPASFTNYYTLFNDPNSRVFADEANLKVLAVLDYHGANGDSGGPRWGQHRLMLALRQSEEWKIWLGKNNSQMNQQQFAEFLEQNSLDVIKPTPASLMDIATDLSATTEVEFGSALRQQDGQIRFKYSETTKTTLGAGQVDVPDRFTVSIPAFVGGARVSMDALLRFRVKEGKLTFWYTLVRPHEVIRTAFLAARSAIATDLGVKIIDGVPA